MQKQVDPKRKRRYNTAHRLRKIGYRVGTDTHDISMTEEQYNTIKGKAQRYTEILQKEYHFTIQMVIPDAR